jgi:steroid delta-isomerase-like uncharacterized protein
MIEPMRGAVMTDCAAKALGFFDAWEKRDYDTLMGYLADGAAVRDLPRGIDLSSRAEQRDWMASWVVACPDSTAGATVPAATTNTAVVTGVYAGTNTGPLGPLPATGKSVSMPFAIALRFDSAGLITDYDVYYDQVTLLTQLGHMPALA